MKFIEIFLVEFLSNPVVISISVWREKVKIILVFFYIFGLYLVKHCKSLEALNYQHTHNSKHRTKQCKNIACVPSYEQIGKR